MTGRYVGMIVCFVSLCCVGVRGGDDIVYEDMTLSLSVPKTVDLGSDVTVGVALQSARKQSAYSIGTADLVITIQDVRQPEKKYICDRGRIRQVTRKLDDGSSFSKTLNVNKQFAQIGDGESSSGDISILTDVGTRLTCGTYSVGVIYEGKVKTNTTFSVVVDSERTVPMLIDLIAGPDEWTRNWARDALFSIVGRPTWRPLRDDPKERIDSEVGALRKWWEENKGKGVLRNDIKDVYRQATNAPSM